LLSYSRAQNPKNGGPKKILGGNHAISRTCGTHTRVSLGSAFCWGCPGRSCLAFVGQKGDASGKNSVIKNEKSLALDMCFCNGGGCLAVGLFGWG